MLYLGNRNEELLEKSINDLTCKQCNSITNQRLIIYCKAFLLGIFYPLKWWSSGKKAIVICQNCGLKTSIDLKNSSSQEPKIKKYFDETPLPLRHKIPTYALFGSILLFGFLIFLFFSKTLYTIARPANDALPGVWNEEYGRYSMYIHEDQTYTLINNDTLVYGNYDVDGFNVTFDFLGRATTFPKLNIHPMRLYDHQNVDFDFQRVGDNPFGDLYTAKMNTWRNIPSNQQTPQQIRNKILDYLQFEIKKYEISLDEDLKYIDIDPNSPLTFALNGIATSTNYQSKWKSIFYNEEDWMTANTILENEFPTDFKIRAYKDNYFQRNLDFLNELKKNIRSSQLEYL